MKKLSEEQIIIVNDKKRKNPSKPLHFFNKRCRDKKKFILMCIIQSMLQHYIKEIIYVDPLKPKAMK
jgi:hypothetical protein